MTGPNLSISDLRCAAICSGVEPTMVEPSCSNFSLVGPCASAATASRLILLTMLVGVLAGTNSENHDDTSKPGTVSAIGGNSGATATLLAVVTAKPRSELLRMCGSEEVMLSNITSSRPGSTSL